MVDEKTGKSRGYGFIEYEHERDFECNSLAFYLEVIVLVSGAGQGERQEDRWEESGRGF